MEIQNFFHGRCFVRYDHLKLVSIFVGNEQIELDRLLRLLFDLLANEKKTEPAVPSFRLPRGIEIRNHGIETPPASFSPNQILEFCKPLKGDRNGGLNAAALKSADDFVAEEGAVHAHFDDNTRTGFAYVLNAGKNELASAVGIIYVSRTEQYIENHAQLQGKVNSQVQVKTEHHQRVAE